MSPRREEADVGYVFFDNSVYFGNCGDGVIGSTTALVETGLLEPRESITVEVPAGDHTQEHPAREREVLASARL